MQDEFWARADELFDAALDLPPEARAKWLDAVCRSEPDLRAKVEQLLELSETEDDRLNPDQTSAELVRELVRRFQSRDLLRSRPESEKPSSSR